MYFSSRNSKRRIFHNDTCRYAKRFQPENRINFYTMEEACNAGFVPCNYCSVIGRQYMSSRQEIDKFCEEHGYSHFMHSGELYVISSDDTAWRITYSGEKGAPRALFHESKRQAPINRSAVPYTERKYHDQDVQKTSIMGYLVYIHKHDIAETKRRKQEEKELHSQHSNRIMSGFKGPTRKSKRKDRGLKYTSGQARIRSKREMQALEDDYWGFGAPAF